MANRKIRMLVEFEVNDALLQDENVSFDDVVKNIVFKDDDVCDGFILSAAVPGFDPTSNFFLTNGKVLEKIVVPEESLMRFNTVAEVIAGEPESTVSVYTKFGLTTFRAGKVTAEPTVLTWFRPLGVYYHAPVEEILRQKIVRIAQHPNKEKEILVVCMAQDGKI